MTPFESMQFWEVSIKAIGSVALWDAALKVLPADGENPECPIIVRVTDGKGVQIAVARINGMPVLVESSTPQRFLGTAAVFQLRWKATPESKQSCIQKSLE